MNRNNNFDLIRLLAALQVLLWHSLNHLELNLPAFVGRAAKYFPGVPIFFVISGFLIFQSFDRKPSLGIYLRSRILRIFPALWVAFGVSVMIISLHGYYTQSYAEFFKWTMAQLTFVQGYTPDAIRQYALYDPNPSLWTIPVEISFYIFVPVLYFICKRFRLNRTWMILTLIALSSGYNYYVLTLKELDPTRFYSENKLLSPYLFYFLFGTLLYVHWPRIQQFYINKAHWWCMAYVSYAFVMSVYLELYDQVYWVNGWGFIGMALLAQLTLSAAYTQPQLSHQLLKKTDISYGIYLYHMIFINLLYESGYVHRPVLLLAVLALTLTAAFLSWKLVEKPMLTKKAKAAPVVSPQPLKEAAPRLVAEECTTPETVA